MTRTLLVLPLLATLVACDDAPKEKAAPKAPAAAATSASTPPATPSAKRPTKKIGPASIALSIEWKVPEAWQKQDIDDSKMLRAKYTVPKADGDPEDGEVGVYYFGPTLGGNKKNNFDRWARQMGTTTEQGKETEKTVGKIKLDILDIASGTFQSGPPMGKKVEKENFGLVGVIVGTSTGKYFFKLTGPSKTVKQARPKLIEMVEGIKETNQSD